LEALNQQYQYLLLANDFAGAEESFSRANHIIA
jgi:hypothetical protein